MNIRKALMQATHTLLGQSPAVSEQDRNLAAITILQFMKDADSFTQQLDQFLAERMAEEMSRKGMGASA